MSLRRMSLRRVSAMGTPLVQLSHPARLYGEREAAPHKKISFSPQEKKKAGTSKPRPPKQCHSPFFSLLTSLESAAHVVRISGEPV
jgi:hypothetical protein